MSSTPAPETSESNEPEPKESVGADYYVEALWPYVVALIVPGIISIFATSGVKLNIQKALSEPVMTFITILLGFIATSMSILLTATGLKAIQNLQTIPGTMLCFIRYHIESIRVGALGCIFSLIVIYSKENAVIGNQKYIFYGWIYSVSCSTFLFLRVVELFYKVLRKSFAS